MEERKCAIISGCSMYFPWGYDEEAEDCGTLKIELLNRITKLICEGVTKFFVVMNAGFGLYAAEMLNGLRKIDPTIQLHCVVPWEDQATKWTPELRERYFNQLAASTNVYQVATSKSETCEYDARMFAIYDCDTAIAIYVPDDKAFLPALEEAKRICRQVITV